MFNAGPGFTTGTKNDTKERKADLDDATADATGVPDTRDAGDGAVRFARSYERCEVALSCADDGAACTGGITFPPGARSHLQQGASPQAQDS